MSTNEEDNLLPLIDNEGNIWLLALLKNKIPLFTEEGPVFSTTHNKGI